MPDCSKHQLSKNIHLALHVSLGQMIDPYGFGSGKHICFAMSVFVLYAEHTCCVSAIGATAMDTAVPINCHRKMSSSPFSAVVPKIAVRDWVGRPT